MKDQTSRSMHAKRELLVIMGVPVALVWYYVVAALRAVPRFESMYQDLGIGPKLPAVSRFLMWTHTYWILIAAALTALLVDNGRRREPDRRYGIAVLIASSTCAVVFHVLLVEGSFQPLLQLMDQFASQ